MPLASNLRGGAKYTGCPTLKIPAISPNNLLRERSGTLSWNHEDPGLTLLRCFRKFEILYYMDRRRPEDSQTGANELLELLRPVLSNKVVHVKIKPFFGAAPTDHHILNQLDPFRLLRCEKFSLDFVSANDRKQPTAAAISLAVGEITRDGLSKALLAVSDKDSVMTG